MAAVWKKGPTFWWSFSKRKRPGQAKPDRYVGQVPRRADGGPYDRRYARGYADTWEAKYRAGVWDPDAPPPAPPPGALTLQAYGDTWVQTLTNASAADDARWWRKFVAPHLGHLRLDELRPRHVRAFVEQLARTPSGNGGTLAPRSVRNAYSVLHRMLARAEADELITASPCKLPRGALPASLDKDPEARGTWVRTAPEVVALLSDPRVPPDRRVWYALLFLTGARFSEVAALRWRAWDRDAAPLGRLTVAWARDRATGGAKRTKTGGTRQVPVHPALARVLAAWRDGGWEACYGRPRTDDDLVVPSRNLTARDPRNNWTRYANDCDALGIPRRRQHDARRTFISLCLAHGARRDVLEWITHDVSRRGAGAFGLYVTLPWPALCEAVAVLPIEVATAALPRGPEGA